MFLQKSSYDSSRCYSHIPFYYYYYYYYYYKGEGMFNLNLCRFDRGIASKILLMLFNSIQAIRPANFGLLY